MVAYVFPSDKERDNDLGLTPVTSPIPEELLASAKDYREKLIEAVSDFDDVIAEKFLNGTAISVKGLHPGRSPRRRFRSISAASSPARAFKKKGVRRPARRRSELSHPSPIDVPATEGQNVDNESGPGHGGRQGRSWRPRLPRTGTTP